MDGARPALAVIASLLRTGQMQVLTETIEQRRARIDSQIIFLAIHAQSDGNRALYYRHCFFRFRCHSRFGARAFPIPKRERNLRRVDFPNCEPLCGVSLGWRRAAMGISLGVQSRIT